MANVYGIESIEFAPISADGSLPSAGWERISPIADDAVTLTIPPVATTDIRAADIPGVYEVLPGDTEPATVEASTLDISGELAEKLFGGTYNAATKTYDAPAGDIIKDYAIRMTSKPLNGVKMRFWLRKAAVLSNITVSLVRTDLARLGFNGRSKTPINAQGVAQSPWGFQQIPGDQTT